jgi:hypothetical protein
MKAAVAFLIASHGSSGSVTAGQGMDGAHHGLGPSAWIGKEAKMTGSGLGSGLSYAGSSIGLIAMLVALIGLGLVIVIVPSLTPGITPPTR